MNQFKGTSQNWESHKNTSWGESHVNNFGDKDGYVICYRSTGELKVLASIIGLSNAKETKANAQLIATAPDLLEACQTAYNFLKNGNQHETIIGKQLLETIEKATL